MIEEYKELKIPCIKVSQPIGDFYLGSISSKDLQEITKIDRRRLAGEKGFETYLGIQRPRNEKRIAEIAKYVMTEDACFPTAVVLSVNGNCAEFNDKKHELTLHSYLDADDENDIIKYNEIANVLDGQHRIEGLRESNFEGQFEINVSIFIDIDIADQAYIFSTINLAQTKVNKSLVYDLFSLAKKRSPQKTCHNIAVALDKNSDSPFYEKIKRLGRTTEGRFNETITQATFVQSLLKYISDDPIVDRNVYMKGSKLKLKSANELQSLIFANMFIEENDLGITDVIWNYFNAIKNRWPEAWDYSGKGIMLNKTNGFKACMRFLRPVYLHLTSPGKIPSSKEFQSIFNKIKINDKDFTTDIYQPGSSGEGKLYRKFLEASQL
jgi:DGQHR domain-containing protein